MGSFLTLKYEDISQRSLSEKYDIAVCNFSLLGKESVERVFKVSPEILIDGGRLIVQTLHPCNHCAEEVYADGWRTGSWDGFSEGFVDPAPWFFRTLESWVELFVSNGFVIDAIREPVNPDTGKAASLLIVGSIHR